MCLEEASVLPDFLSLVRRIFLGADALFCGRSASRTELFSLLDAIEKSVTHQRMRYRIDLTPDVVGIHFIYEINRNRWCEKALDTSEHLFSKLNSSRWSTALTRLKRINNFQIKGTLERFQRAK
jgi:hypothetical protein